MVTWTADRAAGGQSILSALHLISLRLVRVSLPAFTFSFSPGVYFLSLLVKFLSLIPLIYFYCVARSFSHHGGTYRVLAVWLDRNEEDRNGMDADMDVTVRPPDPLRF